jgi:hypothetical protein
MPNGLCCADWIEEVNVGSHETGWMRPLKLSDRDLIATMGGDICPGVFAEKYLSLGQPQDG